MAEPEEQTTTTQHESGEALSRSSSVSDVRAEVPEIHDTLANLKLDGDLHPRLEGDQNKEREAIANIAHNLVKELEQLKEKEKEKEKAALERGESAEGGEGAEAGEGEGESAEEGAPEAQEQPKEEQVAEPVKEEPVKEEPKPEPVKEEVAAVPATPAQPAAPAQPAPQAAPAKPAAASAPAKPSAAAAFAKLARPVAAPKKGAVYGTLAVARPSAKPHGAGNAKARNFNSLLRPKAKVAPSIIKPNTVLVIDNGSAFMKAGVAGESLPRVVIPPVVGTKTVGNDKYLGFKAYEVDGVKLTSAIDIHHGKVNWDYLGDLFEHIFYDELRVDPLNHPILLTELPDMTRQNKEKMTELMFEAFEVPSLYIANPAVMALFSQGMVTGVVVDCGNRMQIVPVIDGYQIESARSQLVPGNITEHLSRLMTERGYFFSSPTQMNIVRKIKERACYVAVDFNQEMAHYAKGGVPDATFTLPDGHEVHLGNERFRAPECLFDPNMVGIDRPGLHKSIFDCVSKCPIDYRTELYSKIVLSGGSTLFTGLPERIKRELGLLLPVAAQRRVNVVAPKNRKYSAWFGGSVYGTLGSFYDHCVTKDTFNEEGPGCIHRGAR